jgi:alpha-tubulin suppressor-like RCC1 family protein
MDFQVGGSRGSRRLRSILIPVAIVATLTMAVAAPAQATPNVAKAWGRNSSGQLGDGTGPGKSGPEKCAPPEQPSCSTVPVAVSGVNGAIAVSGGGSFSLALLGNGTVEAWGEGEEGQLGNGTNETSDVPVAVSGLTGVTEVSAGGFHSLALLSNGTVMAWGSGGFGQLGNGKTENSAVPVAVSGLSGVTAIAAGGLHSLALLSNGTVMAWGRGANGQLGNGKTENSAVPVEVSGLTGVTAVSAGELYSLALLSNGTVMAWGRGANGQLGNGKTENSAVPVAVSGLSGVTGISGGNGEFALALLGNGTVMAWGENSFGQLGDGTSTGPETCGTFPPVPCSKTPVAVSGLNEVSTVSAGAGHSLALISNGTVEEWGSNGNGQLGDGTSIGPESCGFEACSTTPLEVSNMAGAKGSAAGGRHSLAFGPPPTVTAVKPKKGPAGGGTTVVITGTDLTGAQAVNFGSTGASSFTVNSATSITAASPAEPAGRVDVTVTTTWGTSPSSLVDRFRVSPTVTGLSPNGGPAAGGTTVTVTGSGFATGTTATRFRFGRTLATSVNCTSTTTCTVMSPVHPAGTVDVKAIVNHVASPRNRPADQFTYN